MNKVLLIVEGVTAVVGAIICNQARHTCTNVHKLTACVSSCQYSTLQIKCINKKLLVELASLSQKNTVVTLTM